MKKQPFINHSASAPFTAEGDVTERTFRVVMRASRMIWQIMEPFFESRGISLSQWVVLRHLMRAEDGGEGPMRLADLNRRMMVRQPTLTAVVNKLESRGLVRRVTPAADRRERLLSLTPKGRGLLKEVLHEHRERIHGLLSIWDEGDKTQMLGLFEKLADHLELHEQFSLESRPGRGGRVKAMTPHGNAGRGEK